jgi:hypothetical protein
MKYEVVFGNQELFDGAGTFTGLDVVVHSIASGIKSYARLSDLTPESLRNHPVCAMRRIIKEPKRWTREDKKSGRLPEVGSIVSSVAYGYTCYVVAIDSNSRHIWCQFPDQSVGSCMIFEINPIETPAEKVQREEDEFVTSLCKELDGTSLQHDSIYERGVRAAYRKLKGGE